jgi:hypothetical protein
MAKNKQTSYLTVYRQRAYVHFTVHSQVSMDLSEVYVHSGKRVQNTITMLAQQPPVEKSLEFVSLISSVVSKSQNSNFGCQPIILAKNDMMPVYSGCHE